MPSVAIDSSILYALFDEDDSGHARAKRFLGKVRAELVTNVAVLTEVTYTLDWSKQKQREFLAFAEIALVIDRNTSEDLRRITGIMKKYEDLPADFADAALVAMCERMGIGEIATFDSDFDVYRLVDGKMLVNVATGSP